MKFMEKMEKKKVVKKNQTSSNNSQLFHSQLKTNQVWRSNLSQSSKNDVNSMD